MDDKLKWFNVDEVNAKSKALREAPLRRLRKDALEEYHKYYQEKCRRSNEIAAEAANYIPGTVQHNLSVNYPFPIAMQKVEDAYIWDVDGNRYTNYLQAGGATMMGSNDPEIREKVLEVMNEFGAVTGLFSEYELKLTKLVNKYMPHVEMLRMFASGTEADMAMARLVRAYTGKDIIVKLEGGYHGWGDTHEFDYGVAGSREANAVGVPADSIKYMRAVPVNDIDAMRAQLEANEKEGGTAAVVLEPFGPNGGALPIEYDFNKKVRELCDEFGCLLVYDEVITGFRVGMGGAAGFFGVAPDITVFGKALMGSYPMAGGVGGKREIIQHFAPPAGADYKKVHVGGTLTANPMSCVAGYYSLLKMEREDVCGKAAHASERLGKGIQKIFDKYDLPFVVWIQPAIVHIDVTGMLDFTLSDESPEVYAARKAERAAAQNEFAMALLAEGFVTLVGKRFYTSSADTDEVIDATLERLDNLFSKYE